MQLRDNCDGGYQYATGIAPYSAAVRALPGYTIVRVVLGRPLPYRTGFAAADAYMAGQGRTRQALCAVELRSPAPFSFAGFVSYNAEYRQLLEEWRILHGTDNPVARTNVAPELNAPAEVCLYAFSYTVPVVATGTANFVVAGAGELRDQADLTPAAIIRPGETTPEAMAEKAACVLHEMDARLAGVGASWAEVTETNVYSVYPVEGIALAQILPRLGTAGVHGVTVYHSRPPITGLDFEMDVRAVARREILHG